MAQTKFVLDEKELPTRWYNIQADLPAPLPPVIHPGTLQPIGPADLAPLFPMEIIKQEVKGVTPGAKGRDLLRDPILVSLKSITGREYGGVKDWESWWRRNKTTFQVSE